MTEPKFTKGPWVFNPISCLIVDSSEEKNEIADVYISDDADNNGYLIAAAAPDMYAEIQDDIYYLQHDLRDCDNDKKKRLIKTRIEEKEALLAKARGEI